jgi:hypothetical protein
VDHLFVSRPSVFVEDEKIFLWWSQDGLPSGLAATGAWACRVVLAIMSMSQVWYVGRITIAAAGAPIVSISDGAILWGWHSFRYLDRKVGASVTETLAQESHNGKLSRNDAASD